MDQQSTLIAPVLKIESSNDHKSSDSKINLDQAENKKTKKVEFKLRLPKVEFSSRSVHLDDPEDDDEESQQKVIINTNKDAL